MNELTLEWVRGLVQPCRPPCVGGGRTGERGGADRGCVGFDFDSAASPEVLLLP